MAAFSDDDRRRLSDYLLSSLDQDNAGDLDRFAKNFLHNSKVWDLLADGFPHASPSALKSAMLDAYAKWTRGE